MINLGSVKRDKADEILEKSKGEFSELLIIGFNNSGSMVVSGSENITVQKAIYMLECFKYMLIQGGME